MKIKTKSTNASIRRLVQSVNREKFHNGVISVGSKSIELGFTSEDNEMAGEHSGLMVPFTKHTEVYVGADNFVLSFLVEDLLLSFLAERFDYNHYSVTQLTITD